MNEKNKFTELIQVCFTMNDPSTVERETRSLAQASLELNCTDLKIITWDDEAKTVNRDGVIIQVLPVISWLQ